MWFRYDWFGPGWLYRWGPKIEAIVGGLLCLAAGAMAGLAIGWRLWCVK